MIALKLTCPSLQHLASYPSVKRFSHLIRDSVPLAPLIIRSSRSVASISRRQSPRSFHRFTVGAETAESGVNYQAATSPLHRLLVALDATAAQTLHGIDHIVLVFMEAGHVARRVLIWSTSQAQEIGAYLQRTYKEEASKWTGASDIIIFIGAVSFTVAVGAFDAVVYVAEWVFDGRVERELETRERERSEV